MKKLIFILSLFLPLKTNAASFIDTLGAQCGRFLYNMDKHSLHQNIKLNKIQQSRINELKTCLDLYTQYGGNIRDLNNRYDSAVDLAYCAYEQYKKDNPIIEVLPSDDITTQLEKQARNNAIKDAPAEFFSIYIKNSPCSNYWMYKDKYPDCPAFIYLKTPCEDSISKVIDSYDNDKKNLKNKETQK